MTDAPPALSISTPTPCSGCGRAIDTKDVFCRHCGRRQIRASSWYYHPVGILFLAFFVLGPFALGFVWKAPRMGSGVKATLSLIIVAYTAVTFYLTYKVGMMEYQGLRQLGDLMGQIKGI